MRKPIGPPNREVKYGLSNIEGRLLITATILLILNLIVSGILSGCNTPTVPILEEAIEFNVCEGVTDREEEEGLYNDCDKEIYLRK